MIIRKPYAFLIKNFRKIHLLLLVISIFVTYRLIDINSYVNEFMRLGTYDVFDNPISKHINGLLNFSIILLIAGSLSLLILLRYKQKPWKIYLVPVIEYTLLIMVLSMIKGFFDGYTSTVDMADLRLTQDLLVISLASQIANIAIFTIRLLGLDLNKFQFNFDKEFLELSDSDREEIEIGVNFDKRSFARVYRRTLRNVNYFYLEHKTICRIIIGILVANFLFQAWQFIFVTHKSYSEGQSYSINGFTFTVNNAYYTDKDFTGNLISDNQNFLIVDMTAENFGKKRKVVLENFHVKNGVSDFQTTHKLYSSEFRDLGKSYESTKTLAKGEKANFIIIYRVDKKLRKNRFVLYYQEKSGYLRKIRLKVKDLRNLENVKEFSLGDDLELNIPAKPDTISFDTVSVETEINYITRQCDMLSSCTFSNKNQRADSTYKILKIDFSSENYEAKNMIDFLENYGKLSYIDNKNKECVISIENALSEMNEGKTVFVKVPPELSDNTELSIDLIVRNKQYKYHIS